ncbi:MAG: hypothetical protein WEC36_03535 [Phycisphaeraceae bacterium]
MLVQIGCDLGIYHLGACHLAIYFRQVEDCLCTVVVAQNRYHAEANFELTFKLRTGGKALMQGMPTLQATIGASAVVLAECQVPIVPAENGVRLSIKAAGRCARMGTGRCVRFARRPVLQADLSGMGGAIDYGDGDFGTLT